MFIVFVIMLTVLCVESKILVGKAFLCRDPDTGKLHTVNSTWPSSTFCGNYHCKLRKKNMTVNDFETVRQMNFTNSHTSKDITKVGSLLDNVDYVQNNRTEEPLTLHLTPEINSKLPNNDRYLTENEIKTIASILKTMRKSDVEAIVEIYQLAQNIYDEIDKANPELFIHDTGNELNPGIPAIVKSRLLNAAGSKHVSYWYDPIQNNNNKEQLMSIPESNFNSNTKQTENIKKTTPKPVYYAAATRKPATFFARMLTTKDFGRIPYSYPLSPFQRASSYVHQPNIIIPMKPIVHITTNTPKIETTKTTQSGKFQKLIQPSIFLPYPFFNVPRNYNWTSLPTFNSRNYVERLKMTDDKITEPKNAVLINPDLENVEQVSLLAVGNQERYVSPKNKGNINHDWQTDPISRTILDEVRAHIDKTKFIKPLSLRRKIKVERVSRISKNDDLNKRRKRNYDVKNEKKMAMEMFEVYLDKITCLPDDSLPGFFRHGNLSQPYPGCCPQRIAN